VTWIDTLSYEQAKGRLKKLYDNVKPPQGQIDNILTAHSLRPRTLHAHLTLYKEVMHTKPNELSNRERELVGVCVSILNGCNYCVKHHTAGLAKHVGSQELAEELAQASVENIQSSNMTQREGKLCEYAKKLTLNPSEMVEEDIINLREAGLSDAGILDLNQITAYFSYANRTVLGLGVTTEGDTLGLHPTDEKEGFVHK